MKRTWRGLLLFGILACWLPASLASPYTIAMFYPRDAAFWNMFTGFMREAASDLDIKLELYNSNDNRFEMVRQVNQVIQRPDQADAMVFINYKHNGPLMIRAANEARIPCFLVNSALDENEITAMGAPRSRYPFWLGEMVPNEEGSGIQLANRLLDEARHQRMVDSSGKIPVLAINRPVAAGAAIKRLAALNRSISERSDTELLQVVHINDWSEQEAQHRTARLLLRYPQTKVIWVASTRLAQGVMAALRQQGKRPGSDLLTVGYDLTQDVFQQIDAGEVVAVAGGHYIEGAWALVILYDYLHGIDFAADSKGTFRLRTPLELVDKQNVTRYLNRPTPDNFTPDQLARIDFSRYSKSLNRDVIRYEFTLESVFAQLADPTLDGYVYY